MPENIKIITQRVQNNEKKNHRQVSDFWALIVECAGYKHLQDALNLPEQLPIAQAAQLGVYTFNSPPILQNKSTRLVRVEFLRIIALNSIFVGTQSPFSTTLVIDNLLRIPRLLCFRSGTSVVRVMDFLGS